MNIDLNIPSTLEYAVQQFNHWRTTRSKRGKIPDALWKLVAPLMNKYGHNKIASALRVNHKQLKERTNAISQSFPDQQRNPTFIEYELPLIVPTKENCTLEFTCKNGSLIKMSGLTPAHMQSLVSLLLG
jgi:hypothetical protein